MADEVIRRDIIEIEFEVAANPFQEIQSSIESVTGAADTSINNIVGDLNQMTSEAQQAAGGFTELSGQVDRLNVTPLGEIVEDTQETAQNAQKASEQVRALAQSLGEAVKNRFDEVAEGIRSSATAAREFASQLKATTFDNIRSGANSAKDIMSDIIHLDFASAASKIDAGLGKALENVRTIGGNALDKITQIGKASLSKIVSSAGSLGEKLKDVAAQSMDKIVKGLKNVGTAAVNAAKKITANLIKAVSGAVAAAGGLAIAAVKVGKDYESAMSEVAATMGITADKGNESFALLSQAAKDAGISTQFTATQAANALNNLALAGYSAEKSVEVLPTVLDLAVAGNIELADASQLVTQSMNVLGLETQELTGFADQLTKTAQSSGTNVAQLGEAILVAGGQAKISQLNTTELNTALGILADNGRQGSQGGTELRNTLKNLYTPTDKAAKTLASLGVSTMNADGSVRDIQSVLQDLGSSLDGLTESKRLEVMNEIFDTRTIGAANALLENSGARWDELSAAIMDSQGAAAQMAFTMNDNLSGALKSLRSAAEGFGIAFYESVNNPLKDITLEATATIRELAQIFEDDGLGAVAVKLGDIVADVISRITAQLPNLVDLGVDIIESLISGIDANSDTIGSGLANAGLSLADGLYRLIPRFVKAGVNLVKSIGKGILQGLPSVVSMGVDLVTSAWDGITESMPLIVDGATNIINTLLNTILDNLPRLIDSGIANVVALLHGVTQMLPVIANAASRIVTSLVTGIARNLPELLNAGIQAIVALVNTIVGLLPDLVRLGIQLIVSMVRGIIGNLPSIIQSGIEIILSLISGIVGAIPQLIASIPQVMFAIIKTILTTNWLKVGWDIAKAIIGGLVSGVKNLFTSAWDGIKGIFTGGSNDAGKEAADAVKDGLDGKSYEVQSSAYSLGYDTMYGIGEGIDYNSYFAFDAAELVGEGITEGLSKGVSTEKVGEDAMQGIIDGFDGSVGSAVGIAFAAAKEVQNAASNFEGITDEVRTTVDESTVILQELPVAAGETFDVFVVTVDDGMEESKDIVAKALRDIISSITASKIRMAASGKELMRGLNQGILSMRSEVVSTAKGIGAAISTAINDALDINSPSRVTMQTGVDVGLGSIEGMQEIKPDVSIAAKDLGVTIAHGVAEPVNQTLSVSGDTSDAITPENSTTNTRTSTIVNNNYSPQITAEIRTGGTDRDDARKVRNWIRAELDDYFESVARRNPPLREV